MIAIPLPTIFVYKPFSQNKVPKNCLWLVLLLLFCWFCNCNWDKIDFVLSTMTDICKVCLKTVKRWYGNSLWSLWQLEMLKSTAEPWFCIIFTSNILPFCNRHGKVKETITTPTSLFHHNELFHLIKNLKFWNTKQTMDHCQHGWQNNISTLTAWLD